MHRYVIEREFPGAGNMSAEDIKAMSTKSLGVLRELGPDIQWEHTYIADDKVYCVYLADNENLIRRHGTAGGFPVDRISEVKTVIDPVSAG